MHKVALIGVALAAVLSATTLPSAQAQDVQPQDVQITTEAISRTCAGIHHNPGAQGETPSIGPGGNLVINCRLIGPGGMTLAQVSPEEVCKSLNGSGEWYRGMGTQVYCRGGAGETPRTPKGLLIDASDVSRACQRLHHNPQATGEVTKPGPLGLELNCRLINQNGVTLARISPEDVCSALYGTRDFVYAGASFLCRGTSITLPNKKEENSEPKAGGPAFRDVPMTQEAVAKGCQALHGPSARPAPVKFSDWLPVFQCNTGNGMVSHTAAQFCPALSGTTGWYVRALGPEGAVCRGPGPREYDALANVTLYCREKGHRWGNNGVGAQRQPACFDAPGSPIGITIADVCRGLYRTSAFALRGPVHWCLRE